MSTTKRIRQALLSVTDKTGLVEFAQALAGFGVELVSTGGTARALREAGLAVKDISELTGFPEMLDGRVKTLHPKVHGGLLYIRGNEEHEAAVAAHGIEPIDMVVVNLYAFEKTAAQPGVAFGHLIENIDIGGPSMVRSAAKNFEDVAIVTRVADYPALIEELKSNGGSLCRETRWRLAKQAFRTTAAYDTAIANTLDQIAEAPAPDQALPEASAAIAVAHHAAHQPAAGPIAPLRRKSPPARRALCRRLRPGRRRRNAAPGQGTQLQQPRRSRRLLGAGAGVRRARRHHRQAHQPLRRGHRRNLLEAYQKALACDPVSAFGGVIGINRAVDAEAAEEIAKLFVEAIAAPAFTPRPASASPPKRICAWFEVHSAPPRPVVKHVSGGLLCRTPTPARVAEIGARKSSPGVRPPPRSCAACSSPGASASTSNRTPSSMPATARPSASAPAR